MQKPASRKYQTSFLRRYLSFALLIVFGYLLEVCVMPYVKIFGISPNLLYVVIGIVTVAFGKLRSFWVGLFSGLALSSRFPLPVSAWCRRISSTGASGFCIIS